MSRTCSTIHALSKPYLDPPFVDVDLAHPAFRWVDDAIFMQWVGDRTTKVVVNGPKLNTVNQDPPLVHDEGLSVAISKAQNALVHLDLHCMRHLTKDVLGQIATLHNLVHLNLQNCRNLEDEQVSVVL